MFGIIGIVVIFVMVFGGFILAGGKLGIILKALPFELMMIGGAAAGAVLIANSPTILKGLGSGVGKVFAGPKWKASDYRDLLVLLYALTKTAKNKGLIVLESHIENPKESSLFQPFPKILHDHFAMDFICDTIRMMTMNLDDPHQVESLMEKKLEKHHHEALAPGAAMQSLADGTPALGIVAAVLGIIKTMASIDQPVEVLGHMIGGALVGTFLGVFLAYGFFGPFATRMNQVVEEEGAFYKVIMDVLVGHLHGNAAQVSVEKGRMNVPTSMEPSFADMEEAFQSAPTI